MQTHTKVIMNRPSYAAKTLVAAITALTGSLNAMAADGDMITVDGITYTVISETAKTAQLIWDNDKSGDDLTIPSHITSPDNGTQYAVTSIYEQAFAYCEHQSITLPETLLEIGNEAFRGSFSLTEITLPNSVEKIGDMALADCHELTTATLSDAMQAIPMSLFFNSSRLTTVTIGSATTEIRNGAFTGCGNITEIYCKAATPPQVDVASAFPAQDFEKCRLYVPTGSKTAYESHGEWSKFLTITEYNFPSSGVANVTVADKLSVRVAGGTIIVDGSAGGNIEVYSANGQRMYYGTDTQIGGLPGGIYIVRADDRATKVILK